MFKDKTIWITGASSGLGKHLALVFAQQGAKLALSARRKDKLEEVAVAVRDLGSSCLVLTCDVMQEDQIIQTLAAIENHFGSLDVAIANAGYGVYGRLESLEAKDWRRQFEVNVTGLFLTAKHAIPYLKKTKGRLVLLGSVAAYLPNPNTGAYGASKAAVHSIGKTFSLELSGTGVSCTTIHPGFVDSDITRVDNDGLLHPDREDPRPKNLMWPTEKAARVMVKAIAKRKKTYVFTGHGKFMAFVGQHFPVLAQVMIKKIMP
ncbi:SDR family NAD(P)-dependent oxidoreductase [Pararhodonellum marinum]|uniref:SDR family NAD(P)-dependent oxidoreductase n=1 Tax=Pararhodonellum marinum TaxID=2755358 RepID=UPI00188E0899|nr:SDR family NAD(P)-dependent oxidoreductase [Pararhodonellum marinum]